MMVPLLRKLSRFIFCKLKYFQLHSYKSVSANPKRDSRREIRQPWLASESDATATRPVKPACMVVLLINPFSNHRCTTCLLLWKRPCKESPYGSDSELEHRISTEELIVIREMAGGLWETDMGNRALDYYHRLPTWDSHEMHRAVFSYVQPQTLNG